MWRRIIVRALFTPLVVKERELKSQKIGTCFAGEARDPEPSPTESLCDEAASRVK